MSNKKLNLGFDRYLDIEWANQALELSQSSDNVSGNYDLLKIYLQRKISGKETARKTSNQLKYLWLNREDENQDLRAQAVNLLRKNPHWNPAIFHFGMAINVSPIFKVTCKKVCDLNKVQNRIDRNTIIDRVTESYANPTSVPRIVARVIQTLINWGFLIEMQRYLQIKEIDLFDHQAICWFVKSMMEANMINEIPLIDMGFLPEKLGVKLHDLRVNIQSCDQLAIRRNLTSQEIIVMK